MAQKVLIGNAVYEITGGKVLIGGKKYNIVSGKTLLNGEVREIKFGGNGQIEVYIWGDVGDFTDGVIVNGVEYLYGRGFVGLVSPGDKITGDVNWFTNGTYTGYPLNYVVPENITRIDITLSYDDEHGSEADIEAT